MALSSTTRIGSPAISTSPAGDAHHALAGGRVPRQDREERAALAEPAAEPDAAPLGLDEPARQRQPQAGPGLPLRHARAELLELLEEPRRVGLGDADARVLDLQAEHLRGLRDRPNSHVTALPREL